MTGQHKEALTDEQLLAHLYWRCDPHGPTPNTLALEIWEHLRSVMMFPRAGLPVGPRIDFTPCNHCRGMERANLVGSYQCPECNRIINYVDRPRYDDTIREGDAHYAKDFLG